MKIVKSELENDGSGRITLLLEQKGDAWYLYNIVCKGDRVRSKARRKVVKDTGSLVSSEVKLLSLTLAVTQTEFDGETNTVRISGRNRTETPHVKMNQFHTFEVGMLTEISVSKSLWDNVFLKIVEEACDPKAQAEIAAVMLDNGIANLFLLTQSIVRTVGKIQSHVPKRSLDERHAKGEARFFGLTMQSLEEHVDFERIQALILAGPGFVKEAFHDYLFAQAEKRRISSIIGNRKKVLLVKASSPYKHSLTECLSDPSVKAAIASTRTEGLSKALDTVYERLHADPNRVCYGPREVVVASDAGAIQTLLVTDQLFRNANVGTRRRFVALDAAVRNGGGKVLLFPDLHPLGEALNSLSGVAALLKFAVPELELYEDDNWDLEEEEEDAVESKEIDHY